ncbi:MAG: hypothetical protein ACOYNG_07885, partial [Terrimicrobiaceae bacterium]
RTSAGGCASSYSMNKTKAILLNNWQVKLASLILAFALWYLIKQNVGRTPPRLDPPKAPVAESQKVKK